MTTITSDPLELPELEDVEELGRADLVFYGVDHSGPSYEARVFVNNPKADATTECVLDRGYAGSFSVFGHNGCFGDDGHCLPDQRQRDEFDLRAPHPLRPLTMTVIATEAIRRAFVEPAVSELTVTVVVVVPDDDFPKAGGSPAHFEYVRLLTYEGQRRPEGPFAAGRVVAEWLGVSTSVASAPVHDDGASTIAPGLYFAGVHFLRKRKSSLLIGVGEDAAIVAGQIATTARAA